MNKILLITVGGSYQPIVTSINSLKPERVIFICSTGKNGSITQVTGVGSPCEFRQGKDVVERLPNIPTQLNLGERFQGERDLVSIEDPDNLSEAYRLITQKVNELHKEAPTAQLMADYTGGTKTMSVALGMAALDYQLTPYITTSATRENLIKVERGEKAKRVSITSLRVNRLLEQDLPLFLKNYNYPAAILELEILLRETELSPQDDKRVHAILECCEGFEQWDRFNHIQAMGYLKPYLNHPQLQSAILFLKRVMISREAIAPAVDDQFEAPDRIKGHGYEIVEDLLLNAQRRAKLARYDDAVARLYRALELLAQVRLWSSYQIKTGAIEVEKLPDALRPQYEKKRTNEGRIQLGLRDAYILLSQLDNDPLGQLFLKQERIIIDKLQTRNYSILAHGLRPVGESEYQHNFANCVIPFLEQGLESVTTAKPKKLEKVQFPETFDFTSNLG